MRKLVVLIIATSLSVSAYAGPASFLRCSAKPAEFKNSVKGAFVRTQTREGMKGTFAQYIAANGTVIAEHQLTTRTGKQMLMEYAPSKVRASLNAMKTSTGNLVQSVNKESIAQTLKTAGAITNNAIIRFPEEAAAFFFAIGALTYAQAILDYNSNPMAVSQYFESQKDPIGQVAFLNFMVANGLASHAMMQTFKNPSFRPFIPYLGMSVGMTASNIVHELAHIPHIKQCITKMKTGEEDDSCDKAYSSWVDFGYEKMNEYAPSLMSMWASSMLSGVISQCLSAGANWTISQAIKLVGVQVVMSLTPTGWVGRGAQFLGKVGHLGMFVGLDMLIHPYTTKPYNLVEESNDLAEIEEKLFHSLREHKASGWDRPTKNNLEKVLDDLDIQMTQWKNIQLEKVQMAHSSWMSFLSGVTHQYQAAHDYYSHFTENLWEKTYGRYAGKSINILDMKMPLNGVRPNNFVENEASTFVDAPLTIQKKQLETIQIVGELMKDILRSDKVRRHLSDDDVVAYNDIRAGLRVRDIENVTDKDLERIGNTLIEINQRVSGNDPCHENALVRCKHTSAGLQGVLKTVTKLLGEPNPQMKPGQGYALALKKHPEFKNTLSNFAFKGREQSYNILMTPDNPSFLAASMMYGRTTSEPLVTHSSGFAARFFPPRIALDNTADIFGRPNFGIPSIANSVYHVQMGTRSKNRPDQFVSSGKSIYESLAGGNIIPEIFNPNKNGFTEWWEKNVEVQFVQAWLSYESKYQAIVSDLVNQLWNRSESNFNGSGMRSGTMYSLRQERQISLMILGEIFKATYPEYPRFLSQKQNSPIKHASGTDYRNGITRLAVALGGDSTLNMFARIDANESAEFDAIMGPSLKKHGTSPDIWGRNFEFQNKIRESFGRLYAVIQRIRPIQIERKGQRYKVTASTVTNGEIDAEAENVKATIAEAKKAFEQIDSNTFKGKIVKKAFTALETNLAQIVSYAKVANAVSYVQTFKDAGGKPVNPRCQSIAKVTATNAAQRFMQKECEQSHRFTDVFQH